MAVIEYRITVDASGNTEVFQDVRRIDVGDVLIFSTDNANLPAGETMAIRYQGASPFTAGPHPQANTPFLVVTPLGPNINGLVGAQKHTVQQASHVNGINQTGRFGTRKTFHFECGHANPANPGTTFTRWTGTPGGNSGSVGD